MRQLHPPRFLSGPPRRSRDASSPSLRVRGVRVHNLRGVDATFPRNHMTVVSGVSGSGKSSLAFDTLYAEGRRRYVECLSTYTRQFLERTERPDVDAVEGITPAVAIQRTRPASQARSTVGTATEIHDYLRLLFARVGIAHCVRCGLPVAPETTEFVVESLLRWAGRGAITYRAEGRDDGSLPDRLAEAGFTRAWVGGRAVRLADLPPSERRGPFEVVVDRVDFRPDRRSRLAEAVEVAYRLGHDRCSALRDGEPPRRYSRAFHCAPCDLESRRPEPALFSPNSPLGACPECRGFGRTVGLDMSRVIPDRGRTLREGPIDPWNKPAYREAYSELRKAGAGVGLRWDVPYRELPPEHRELVEEGAGKFVGIRGFFRWLERRTYKVHVRVFLTRYRDYRPCEACRGRRLRPEALAVRIAGADIGEVGSWRAEQARAWVENLEPEGSAAEIAAPVLRELRRRLHFLVDIGLGYLSLDRPSRTLSGGEAQRIQIARCLGGGLCDTLYVLDEPSIGLHPRDADRLLELLRRLRDLGNTIVLVEHDPRLLLAADHLVDLGPGAGERGGTVVYEGPVAGVASSGESLTGAYLTGRLRVPRPARRVAGGAGWIVLEGASIHNLVDLTVRFPRAALTVVTGVSGSGKSSLVQDTLHGALARAVGIERAPVAGPYRAIRGAEGIRGVELVDQSPIGKSPRSNPVTYVGAFDGIRRRLAATHSARSLGLDASAFSFNVRGGRCEACAGAGSTLVEMHFLPDVLVACSECGGRRFGARALGVRDRGRSVADILAMTVDEAMEFFGDDRHIARRLSPLVETGLGYLRLGQPATTLSGGEAQRLKLATHLGAGSPDGPRVFLLDEPTAGLHLDDLATLVRIFGRLLDGGHTIVVVEHHLDLILASDWVVDLGPGAGPEGGRLVAEGPPEVVARSTGITGRYVADALRAKR